jgi:hypothetical protein
MPKGPTEEAQDFALRRKLGHWETKDLMQSPIPPARGLVPWDGPRVKRPRAKVLSHQAIPTGSPKTIAQRDHRLAYALRLELGERAYADWTGKAARRPKPDAEASRPKVVAPAGRELRPNGLVLFDTAAMNALGITAIGNVE